MKQCSPLCNKILGIVRIVAGLRMVYAGLMKLGADAEMIEMVGAAGPALGLTFLSATTWFWIAVVGEILAGLFLVSGCCKLTKIGAWLTIVIMIFALNLLGWTTPDTLLAWVFLIVAVVILVWGNGARCFCPAACCKMGASCQPTGGCCGGGACGADAMKDGMNQMKSGAVTIGAGAVASAEGMVGKAKDMATAAKEVASDMVEKSDTLVQQAQDIVENVGESVKKVGEEAGEKIVATTEAVLEKADEIIDDAKDAVEKASDKVDNMKNA